MSQAKQLIYWFLWDYQEETGMLRNAKGNIQYCHIIFNEVMKFSTNRSKQPKEHLNNPLKAKYNIHVSTSKKLKSVITFKSLTNSNKFTKQSENGYS